MSERKIVESGNKSYETKDPVLKYVTKHSLRLLPVQEKLIQETMKQERYVMLGSPDELQLLANLVKYMGFKKSLDVGVFTGYSAMTIAMAMPDDGVVVACDISEDFPKVGKPFWKEAGVDHKINLVVAPAAETLQSLLDKGEASTFDFAFIDADKPNYDTYFELCLKLIRPGGLIAIDNTLSSGRVLDPENTNEIGKAIHALNVKLSTDQRIDISMLTIGDGTTLAFKKKL